MSVTARALWYIESHLDGELSLETIAAAIGISRFHLCRAFGTSLGCSLAAYARARRLSEAARRLAGGAPDILALALEAGYASHEAFTRAFRQHFAATPEEVRARTSLAGLAVQEPLRMNAGAKEPLSPPRLERRDAILIFGLGRPYGRCADPSIPSQWNAFLPHLGHIDGQLGDDAYGVICNSDEAGSYDYVTGAEVSAFPSQPRDFTRLRIPPARYAVFAHKGHVSNIFATWKAIWEDGLSKAVLEAVDGPAFELYGKSFDGRTGMGGFEIWVPVKG